MVAFRKFGSGDRGGFSKGPRRAPFGKPAFGGRISTDADRPKYPATCSRCGASCEVPFRPTRGKEVLCRDCFRASGTTSRERRSSRASDRREVSMPDFTKPTFKRVGESDDVKVQLEMINSKLDKITRLIKESGI